MAGPARLAWQKATVEAVTVETYRVKTFRLRPQEWRPFRPGQHMDVRLTAPDGYQAQRSYSIATAPEQAGTFDLTVELMEGGEVSPFFHEVVAPGDALEVRGPIGGPFTWTVQDGGPVLMVAGGSGIVPLMSMLRHWRIRSDAGPTVAEVMLLYSSRMPEDVIYRVELNEIAADSRALVAHTYTRKPSMGWKGYARRVDRAMIAECMQRLGGAKWSFICGPTAFVEVAADAVVTAGMDPARVRTERFGPTGT